METPTRELPIIRNMLDTAEPNDALQARLAQAVTQAPNRKKSQPSAGQIRALETARRVKRLNGRRPETSPARASVVDLEIERAIQEWTRRDKK